MSTGIEARSSLLYENRSHGRKENGRDAPRVKKIPFLKPSKENNLRSEYLRADESASKMITKFERPVIVTCQ